MLSAHVLMQSLLKLSGAPCAFKGFKIIANLHQQTVGALSNDFCHPMQLVF